jgi:lysozyme
MSPIQLADAARHFRDLPHQEAAWSHLQDQLTVEQLEVFARMYRDAPPSGDSAIDLALPLIRHFEGLELRAYPDPLSGDPWTIGIGSTRHLDGRPVRPGDVITEPVAWEMLICYAEDCYKMQSKRIPTWLSMTANQQAAILSFSFNFGKNWYGSHGFATLTRNLQDYDWAAVPETLKLYINPGSGVESGLLRRRVAEGELFSTGKWA